MTKPHSSSTDSPLSQEQRQQCMLYLLGELDAAQASELEQKLQTSTEFADELLRQADLINALSQTPQPTVARTASTIPWPIAASILAAIAACFAIILFHEQPGAPERDSIAETAVSEDLLIARAWADSHLIVDASDDFAFNDPATDDTMVMAIDDASDTDATLKWMFIAVSANLDSQPSETTNDG